MNLFKRDGPRMMVGILLFCSMSANSQVQEFSVPPIKAASAVAQPEGKAKLTKEQEEAARPAVEYLRQNPQLLGQEQAAETPKIKSVYLAVIPGLATEGGLGQPPELFVQVTFEGQKYRSLPVDGTEISVRILDGQVKTEEIENRWYKPEDIHIPVEPQKSEEDIRQRLVSYQLKYPNSEGREQTITLKDGDLKNKGQLAVLPQAENNGQKPGFKLVWKIMVGTKLRWMLYVDAETGEVLEERRVFHT